MSFSASRAAAAAAVQIEAAHLLVSASEALRNAGDRPAMEKAVHNATQGELNNLEMLVPMLATVASIATPIA